jgi:hypothetical protein
MRDIDVDALLVPDPDRSLKSVSYKTVDVFAGITGRKLWLKASKGGVACTNGYLIEVPFEHPRAYQLVEHEISHILFLSDPLAKAVFVQEYASKVSEVAAKRGVDLDARALRAGIDMIVGILDDERVISLWGLLYRGSERIMRRMQLQDTECAVEPAHEGLIHLFAALAGGHQVKPGKLDRFKPYMLEALRKVHLRDYYVTLVTAKWLVTMLVSEIIREAQGEPPMPVPDSLQLPGENGSGGAGGDQEASGSSDTAEEENGSQNVPQMPYEVSEPEEAPEEASGGRGQGAWQPPEVKAGAEERTRAVKDLVERMGRAPNSLRDKFDDVQESKFKRRGEEAAAKRKAQKAIGANVTNADSLERVMEASTEHMTQIVKRVQDEMRNTVNEDDRIRRDAMARVVFHDVKRNELANKSLDLKPGDQDTVRRLRATFFRVMGRRKSRMEDAGAELDIPAYIARRLTREPLPVFRADAHGRGFKSVILIDRSSSMKGVKTQQAERGCRVISRALKFPFVQNTVWGFQSWEQGQVDITRFESGNEVFESDASQVGGTTPLHTAIRVAIRHLEEGSEKKQLFVISDGFPVFVRKDGGVFGTRTLMAFIRKEVQSARAKGIGVTGIMIGRQGRNGVRSDVSPKNMSFMFGSKHWRVMGQAFGNDLIHLVTRSFVDYLRTS